MREFLLSLHENITNGILVSILIMLHFILRELRKQTALSREARDFVKKKHEPPVMHSQDKATYRY